MAATTETDSDLKHFKGQLVTMLVMAGLVILVEGIMKHLLGVVSTSWYMLAGYFLYPTWDFVENMLTKEA